jgi:hypothetical protein
VAARRSPAGSARGGEDIQAPRPAHARVATGFAAILVAAAIAVATTLRADGIAEQATIVGFGAVALALLLFGLVLRWSAALGVGIALLGAQQAARLSIGNEHLDTSAPLAAAALLLAAELAWWSIEPRIPAWAQRGLALRRLAWVLFLCLASGAVAALVMLTAGAPLGGGFGLELMGVLAAMGALGVLVYVARGKSAVD